ncbi:MAG: mRNA-decapping enzyme subunit 2 [Lichina confinis]|nr:MAG: mRNA-decapping enzyme subunit 2 [Lichina confinis]
MAQTKMKLEEWLDDLCVRFIINLPQEELTSVERICFHVEEAQWFYEDFVRPLDPALPSMALRAFCLRIFQHCPLFSDFTQDQHLTAFSEFLAYKTRVPVRGAILLNDAMDQVVLVKGWKKAASWSFPRGKINKDERDLDCAVREVDEETGFDVRRAGLVTEESEGSCIDTTMREQNIRMYVFRGVPMDTHFEPKTRKEISKVEWHRLSDLPTLKKSKTQTQTDVAGDLAKNSKNFYMVAPFLAPLKKWIASERKAEARTKGQAGTGSSKLTPESSKADGPSAASITIMGKHKASDASAPSKTQRTTEEMSMELKRFLSIQNGPPSGQKEGLQTQTVQQSNQEKSKALLSLLQKGVKTSAGQDQNVKPPLPDMTQSGPAAASAPLGQSSISPQNTPDPLQSLFNRPPPGHPVPSADFSFDHQIVPMPVQQPGYPFPVLPREAATAASTQHARQQTRQHARQPSQPATQYPPHSFAGTPAHVPVAPRHVGSTTRHGRHDSQLRQETPTMKPGTPHYPNMQAPCIPTPAQLPPPKLTSHSLQLLNVLRNGQKSSSPPGQQTQQAGTNSSSPAETETFPQPSTMWKHRRISSGGPQPPLHDLPPYYPPIPAKPHPEPIGNKPADHRQNLLSLFRSPSGTPKPTEATPPRQSPVGTTRAPAAPSTRLPPPVQSGGVPDARQSADVDIAGRGLGSAPTTSPAHKEFLLGYLDAVANGSSTTK